MDEIKIKDVKQFLNQIANTANQLNPAEMLRVMGYIEGITARRDMGGSDYTQPAKGRQSGQQVAELPLVSTATLNRHKISFQ